MQKRIIRHCMVVHKYYPTDIRVRRQALALRDHGIEVTVVCLRRPGQQPLEVVEGVTVHRLALQLSQNSGPVTQLFEYLAFFILASFHIAAQHLRQRYDVIQAHNLPDFLVFVALIPKLTGARAILDLHDLMPEFFQGRFGQRANKYLGWLVLLQERLSCRFADHVLTVTEYWRQVLIARGVPSEKCSVVMNLADPHLFPPNSARPSAHPNGKGLHLIYHGYMPDRYGLDLVLIAMNQIRHQVPGIHLTLIGGGEHLETLKQMAADLDLIDKHVAFIPPVPVEEVPPYIQQADLGIVPYRNDVFTDTLLPTKLLEYALMGLPSIAARTTVISSYFDDTMVQFFTPGDVQELADCLLTIYTDPGRLGQLAQGIERFNQRYSWSQSGDAYAAIVEQLAAK